ncbi:MAG: F0F1 ATP synthase subunit B [Heliobacteriaceae bacterium]|nr:F0F1 ATP synthase subunit B [Heliobacteriaceae bacterium]MDD4587835.1 F0F1 ATP synthase subunit B [Heliobacteriaceae bacterium]
MFEALSEALKFDVGTYLAQIISFLLLVALLRAVAWKPILKALDERKRYIEETISAAENRQTEAERVFAQYSDDMQKARAEAQEIIQRAQKQADGQKAEIIEAARAEAIRLKESALTEINREKEKALVELRKEVVELSVLVAGKIIEEKLDVASQRKLVGRFVDEVGKLPC